MNVRRTLHLAVVAAAAFAALTASQFATPQSAGQVQIIAPLTRDLGALQTLTATTGSTVSSSDQSGFNVSRIACVFRQTNGGTSPSSTFSIQNKDAASGVYYSIITSAAVTTTSTNPIYAGAGVTTTANVSAGLPIARVWRTSITIAGATPSVTGTIGCNVQ